MRKTVHILPKELISAAFNATKKSSQITSEKHSQYLGVTKEQYEQISKTIVKLLKGGAMTSKQIKKELGTQLNVSAIVNLMCDQGLLIRGEPEHGWKSNIHTYYLFEDYFLGVNIDGVDENQSKEVIVKHYIGSFGPVTETDVVWWTGFRKREVKQCLEKLQNQVSKVEIGNLKSHCFMLSSDFEAVTPTKPEQNVVNLLPNLDPYLMGYKERERYLNPKYYSYVFDRSGNATSTILVNGQVIGVWDIEEKDGQYVKLFLFEDAKKELTEQILVAAKSIGKFILENGVQVKTVDSMVPLPQRTAGGFMSPLKG